MTEHPGHQHGQGEELPSEDSLPRASELERIFDEVFSQRWPRAWMRRFHWDEPAWGELGPVLAPHPKVQLLEEPERFIVRAQLPGLRKEQLEVFVEERRLIIRGRSSRHSRAESDEYYRSHTSWDEFSRTVELPAAVDGAKASARISDGMLEVTLPRLDRRKRYRITIDE
jgi:HSP20 family protein